MISEKALLLRRGNASDVATFMSMPKKHNTVDTRYERVSNSHGLIKELLKVPIFQCESLLTDDSFGYSEDYLFYVGENKEHAIKLNIRSCEQWQIYSRSIYRPSTLLEYNKLVEECNEKLVESCKQPVISTLFGMMRIAQQSYTTYVDGDSEEFIFSIENNQKFSKLTFEVNSSNMT